MLARIAYVINGLTYSSILRSSKSFFLLDGEVINKFSKRGDKENTVLHKGGNSNAQYQKKKPNF